jgi:ElaB/YqjD/DUF883 family membrane-anchored ribosome-binding protein
MADYKERFEKWQQTTKEKFEEIDKQLGIKEKIEESAKVVLDTAQKSAETLKEGAQRIKTEAEKSEVAKQAVKVAEETVKTAGETAKKAWEASEPIRNVAEDASGKAGEVLKNAGEKAGEVFGAAAGKAGEVFDETRSTFESTAQKIAKAVGLGASWTRTIDSAVKTVSKTADWLTENPLQAATTGVSVIVGAGLGAGMTLMSSNWLFNSALPAWSVKKVGEQFTNYLENQEELVKKGDLTKAEAERIQFERDIVKYVGAPLLGAFSFGAGAMMWANMFNPKTITGAPISWLLGGNPLLEGVWLFGNGIVCFKVGYEFFMVALEDHEDVQRMVKELKGLLPQGSEQ